MSDNVDVDNIEVNPKFTAQVPLSTQNYSYNKEQFPSYEKKVAAAMI
jgi:hypothetical protein